MEEKEDLTDKIVFLRYFLPKNFGRISPLVHIFWISVFLVVFGLSFFRFFWIFAVIGGFVFMIFALYAYFWRNPLL